VRCREPALRKRAKEGPKAAAPVFHFTCTQAQTGATFLNFFVALPVMTSSMSISNVPLSGSRDLLIRSVWESGDQTGFKLGRHRNGSP